MRFFPYQVPVSADYYKAWTGQVSDMLSGKVGIQAGLEQVKTMIQPQLE
jgi:hypothetical protein